MNTKSDAGAALSRRAFLKTVGAGVTAMMCAQLMWGEVAASADRSMEVELEEQQTPAVLIDLSRCIGCSSCALACKEKNNLSYDEGIPQAFDANTYTYVEELQVPSASGEPLTRYAKRQCMHCLNPACATACPSAAMHKSEEGPVIYRSERCLGCRYCQISCPFGVPSFDWDNALTPRISKCWFCYDRLQEGEKPACVEACPTGALRFGWRDELLAQARAQIDSNPGRYVDHIFGEYEMGGTSMLYLSDIPFADLGFPVDLSHEAPSEETEKVMGTLPAVIVGVGALMAGTAAYTHRDSLTRGQTEQSSMEAPGSPEEQEEE